MVRLRLGGTSSPILYEVEVTGATEYNFSQAIRTSLAATNPYYWTESDGFLLTVTQVSTVVGESPIAQLQVRER